MTLTLNKNFSIQFFIVSNRRHIASYIHISGLLVHRCKSYKKLLQNMSNSHFFNILEIVKICIFKQSRATHVCNIPYLFLFSHIEQCWYSIQECLF